MIPRLHIVTNGAILGRSTFPAVSQALLERHGSKIALHLRGHALPARRLYDLAATLTRVAKTSNSLLVVNDRVDIALILGMGGVQIGTRSLPLTDARHLLGPSCLVGVSVHGSSEARSAQEGADFLLAGTVFGSSTHPGRGANGLDWLADLVRSVGVPVLGIGGVSVEVARSVREVAHGIAVISGIWDTVDPVDAAGHYLAALEN